MKKILLLLTLMLGIVQETRSLQFMENGQQPLLGHYLGNDGYNQMILVTSYPVTQEQLNRVFPNSVAAINLNREKTFFVRVTVTTGMNSINGDLSPTRLPWNVMFHPWSRVPINTTENVDMGLFYPNGVAQAADPIAFNALQATAVNPHDEHYSPNNARFQPEQNREFMTFSLAAQRQNRGIATYDILIHNERAKNNIQIMNDNPPGFTNPAALINYLNSGAFKNLFQNRQDVDAINQTIQNLTTIFGIQAGAPQQPAQWEDHNNAGMDQEAALAAAMQASLEGHPNNQQNNDIPEEVLRESRQAEEQRIRQQAAEARRQERSAREAQQRVEQVANMGPNQLQRLISSRGVNEALREAARSRLAQLQQAERDSIAMIQNWDQEALAALLDDPRTSETVMQAARDRLAQLQQPEPEPAQPAQEPMPQPEPQQEPEPEAEPECSICFQPLSVTATEDLGELGREYCVHIGEQGFTLPHRFHINCLRRFIQQARQQQNTQRINERPVIPLRCPGCNVNLRSEEITNIDRGIFPACTPTARPQPPTSPAQEPMPQPEPAEPEDVNIPTCALCAEEDGRILWNPCTNNHPDDQWICGECLAGTQARTNECSFCRARYSDDRLALAPAGFLVAPQQRNSFTPLLEEYHNEIMPAYAEVSEYTRLEDITRRMYAGYWSQLPEEMQGQLRTLIRDSNQRRTLDAYMQHINRYPARYRTIDDLPNTQDLSIDDWQRPHNYGPDTSDENIRNIVTQTPSWRDLPLQFQEELRRAINNGPLQYYIRLLNPENNGFAQPYNTLNDVPEIAGVPINSFSNERQQTLQEALTNGHVAMAQDYYYERRIYFSSEPVNAQENAANHFMRLRPEVREQARQELLRRLPQLLLSDHGFVQRPDRHIVTPITTGQATTTSNLYNTLYSAIRTMNIPATGNDILAWARTVTGFTQQGWDALPDNQMAVLITTWNRKNEELNELFLERANQLIRNYTRMQPQNFPAQYWMYVLLGQLIEYRHGRNLTEARLRGNDMFNQLPTHLQENLIAMLRPAQTPMPPLRELTAVQRELMAEHLANVENGDVHPQDVADEIHPTFQAEWDAGLARIRNIWQETINDHIANIQNGDTTVVQLGATREMAHRYVRQLIIDALTQAGIPHNFRP